MANSLSVLFRRNRKSCGNTRLSASVPTAFTILLDFNTVHVFYFLSTDARIYMCVPDFSVPFVQKTSHDAKLCLLPNQLIISTPSKQTMVNLTFGLQL